MRRQDIQLLALARQGDAAARREVGRRYLLGADGFPHHVASGLEYLARDEPAAARIISLGSSEHSGMMSASSRLNT